MTTRPIETDGYPKLARPAAPGQEPKLAFLPIASLVIDASYQREITKQGRANVRRIAERFNWSMFGTVIVAAVSGGRYAIVDGQHRVTAAAICGIDKVPCQIIAARPGEQAAAFRAINGNVTKLHALQLFHAAVAAGDAQACAVAAVCAAAGVQIVRSPTQSSVMKPGQTMVAGTIGKAIERFGRNHVVASLRALINTEDGNAGLLGRTVVWGVIEVLADHRDWLEDAKQLRAAMESLDLDCCRRAAAAAAARVRGSSTMDQFESLVVDGLSKFFDKRSRAAR